MNSSDASASNTCPETSAPRGRTTPRTHNWFPEMGSGSADRLRLFCFPFAGGHAGQFRPWMDALSASADTWPVQLPGRMWQRTEPAYADIVSLINDLTPAISGQLDRPFALFGHSMGALIAFELCRELRRRHLPLPACLIVSGHRAPQLPDPNPRIAGLPGRNFLNALRKLGGMTDEVAASSELTELFLPTAREDFALCETYRYQQEAPLDCPIVALCGAADLRVSPDEIPPWKEQTTSVFSCRIFPGGHFYFFENPELFLEELSRALANEHGTAAD